MTVAADPRVGTELAGYRIEALLGRGGMSAVYRAFDPRLKRKVALKLIAPELAEDDRFRERFLRESELAASLDHPNVIPIYEAGEADGLLYIAMRYVEGTDLKGLLHREGPLEPDRALSLVAQVAEALDSAHERGLVHRDVKPANVLIADQGREHCYLCDFGLTKDGSSRSGITATGQLVGTIDYVAPELIEGKQVDARADLYSLGCLFYECLTGEVPFKRDSEAAVLYAHLVDAPPDPSRRRPELPPGLHAVIARALAKSPAARHTSCREFVAAARLQLEQARSEPARGERARSAAEEARARLPHLRAPRLRRPRRPLVTMAALALAGTAVALPAVLSSRGGGANAEPTLAIKVDSIARIDPARNKLVATIGSGSSHAGQVLAVGAGAVWVANRLRNEVVRIDPKANRVAKRIRANGSPGGLAFGGGSLWLVDNANGSVAQIDARRSSITHVIPLNGNASSGSIAVAGGSIWVDDGTPGRLVRIDPRSRAWTPVDLGGSRDCAPEDFVAQLAGGRGAVWAVDYDPCLTASGLLRIDPRDNAVVPVPEPEPQRSDWGNQSRLAAAASGIWITHNPAGLVLRIDPTTERVTRTIKVGTFPVGVAVGAGAVWVANRDDGTVSRIDPKLGKVVATIRVGPNPDQIAVGEGGVWVAVHPSAT